ncbi:excalibur calcium-binding domain-containing protein [Nocardia callitridis]|uniref:Excalibur calcium-binding domain-containing protein n=1 Tax=Nocardia callitridis TaxID=648753 RepID=A0ABP9JX15_9NOCA
MRTQRPVRTLLGLGFASLLAATTVALGTTTATAVSASAPQSSAQTSPRAVDPYYENCDAARAAGDTPLYRDRGDPGYAEHLDRDRDGIACE